MSITEPIRNIQDLQIFLDYYRQTHPNPRNHALIILGLHTALRISDTLSLRWSDVYCFQTHRYHQHVQIHEKKTGKPNQFALCPPVTEALEGYRITRKPEPADYIFSKTTDPTRPISRIQVYRLIRKAADETIPDTPHISCHSLRKTFGYHAWKQGASPVLLMDVFNHSSFTITKRYLGIDQDDRDALFYGLCLDDPIEG